MREQSVDVVIPVFRPGKELDLLLESLLNQTIRPGKIILMNTRARQFDPQPYVKKYGVELHELDAADFDHAGTRNLGASCSNSEFLVFMTQDAVPADEKLIEELIRPFADEKTAVVYARQLPAADCNLIERYTRSFNYPDHDIAKTLEDLPRLGIKTYFCSDVCAAYRRSVYESLGRFEEPAVFNEDMIMAHHLIHAGHTVYYASRAQVIHSHNYTNVQQFHRNFDLAVSQAQHPEIFSAVSSESEGKKMVLSTAKYLLKKGHPFLVIRLVIYSGAKYLGFFTGKRYDRFSHSMILRFTSNPNYWKRVWK